ncbi:MAG: hemolysin III family protein [Gemmatimonadaceae bacterium]|nr:hemolysin III family protein [Gemmatimonadaceae bacterium]NUQ91913.1 hemolysin III family protein [Gemmatimonadaceae bacterium]NUR21020.1 hemolysin III family protein [Gemmatimonadaceae bacterium]NUS97254.1 hemolysin III family protein [Gemmatimonadaceae bacterium]
MPTTESRPQTLGEEIASSITHGMGLAASIVALPLLIVAAARQGDAWRVTSAAIFGSSLVLLYTASTLYHALPRSRAKDVFRVIDHSAIYALIAGTYTPFLLGPLRGPWGWSLLAIVWALAAAGIVAKSTLGFRWARLSTAVYLLMGWIGIVAARPLLERISFAGIAWILAGGLAYTAGVLFFVWDERIRYGHAIWHLFVATGSVCHVVAVLGYTGSPRVA